MVRYDDYRSSTGTLDSRWDPRERQERLYPRAPPVIDRPRREEERFEARLRSVDQYGPPARRPGRQYEDDHLVHTSGPLMAYDRPRGESPPPRPRLLRRQSSLDTFDRIPSRKLDEMYIRDHAPRPVLPPRRRSPSRYREADYYEEIHIAEPDYYGDEEYRGFRDRDHFAGPPRRSSSRVPGRVVEEVVEKPYPRKGKTRIPKKLAHPRAIIELGYPFREEDNVIVLEKALSKDQIDEVISLSRQIRRRSETQIRRTSPSPVRESHRYARRHAMEDSPRSSRDLLIVEPASSRHRSHSRHHHPHHHHPNNGMTETRRTRTVSRTRSISTHGRHRRRSSPPARVIHDRNESEKVNTGPLAIMIRPRDSEEDLEELLEYERRGRRQVVRDTEYITPDGDREEILETKRERKSPNPRLIRAMMATLT